jgi:site-specific DNA-methyltransferase (adenine-specific)
MLILGDSEVSALTADAAAAYRFFLFVSDPPYGIGYKSGPNSSASISTTGKRFEEDIEGDDQPFNVAPWLAAGFAGYAMTGAHHYADRLPATGSYHVWNKRGPYKPIDQADGDLVWVSKKQPLRIFDCVWRGLCRHVEKDDPIVHPTQKPVSLMEWMMGLIDGADCVFDPYMGSGTTGLAALRLGRKFVGWEKREHHFLTACQRIEDAQRQSRLIA